MTFDFGGIDPSPEFCKIPEFDNSKNVYPPCKYCGANHGMGVENTKTGEITPIDICKKCLWKPVDDQLRDMMK